MKLRIEQLVSTGDGLAHTDAGVPVLVPFTLPGELIELDDSAVLSDRMRLIEDSPHRVAPRCMHFGACGGCQYQHMDYGTEVTAKAAILLEILAAAGLSDVPKPQLHTAEPWLYRNRIRLRFDIVEGALRFGYNRRGSYDLLPIIECPIAAPLLIRAAETLRSIAAKSAIWSKQLAGIELFCNGDETRLQSTLFLRSERGLTLSTLCDQVKAIVPQLAGAGVVVVGASGRKEQPGAHWGADGLVYRAGSLDYWVSRDSFFQVNRFLLDELVGLVTAGRHGTLAWDLYAGAGLFSRVLAGSFTRVVGVETVVGDLAASSKVKGDGQEAVGTTTNDFLRMAVLQRERPDLVVMDPPRAGLGAEVCDLLIRVAARQMVYVSCDPQTLARDLKPMVDSGYTMQAMHLVDLFPQTFHMETVVVLNR